MSKNKKDFKNLEEAIIGIRKEMGDDAIIQIDKDQRKSIESIPTGSFSLDDALGVGGVPKGKVIEIFGQEATGKTTLALHIIREAQKLKGVAAFIDAENALDLDYAELIGINVGKLLISQPDSAEQALQIVEGLVNSKGVSVIVIDSVAALSPRAEIEGEIGDVTIGLQARLMSSTLRKLSKGISESGTSVIFLNQVRQKIGGYGNPEVTSGGLALKFYSSVRIQLKKGARLKSKDVEIGQRIKANVVKNKVAPPFRTTEYDIYYDEGISYVADVLGVAIEKKIIGKAGAWLSFEDKKAAGFEGMKKELENNDELLKKLVEKVRE